MAGRSSFRRQGTTSECPTRLCAPSGTRARKPRKRRLENRPRKSSEKPYKHKLSPWTRRPWKRSVSVHDFNQSRSPSSNCADAHEGDRMASNEPTGPPNRHECRRYRNRRYAARGAHGPRTRLAGHQSFQSIRGNRRRPIEGCEVRLKDPRPLRIRAGLAGWPSCACRLMQTPARVVTGRNELFVQPALQGKSNNVAFVPPSRHGNVY